MKLALGLGINQRAENLESMSGFSIDSLSGLVAWYPFNTGQTESSGALSSWADASGNSRTLINTLQTNKRPTYQSGRINFGNVTNSFMDINNGPVPNSVAYTLFFVVEFAVGSGTSFNTLVSSASNTNSTASFTWGTLNATTQLFQVLTAGSSSSDSSFNAVVTTNLVSNNVKTILQYSYGGGTTAGDTDFIISKDEDGGTLTQITSRTLANASNHTQGFNAVGLDNAGFYPKGFIDEIVIFNRKLSVSEAADVRADIKARNSMT